MTAAVSQLVADLERYRQNLEWPKVVETIKQLAELDEDPMRRGTWLVSAGGIYRDDLQQPDEALDCFHAALDAYFADPDALTDARLPMALMPWRTIERMHTYRSEWRPLDRAYRKMIVRVRSTPRFAKLCAGLFDQLGELYRTRLDEASSARAAFEEARKLDPANDVRTEGVDRDGFLARPA